MVCPLMFCPLSLSNIYQGRAALSLDDYLSSNLYTPVETLDLATLFDLARTPELQDRSLQGRFFIALGAALRAEAVA